MIVFDLSCACGCQFEGWFRDREDFDRQEKDELLICPSCGGGRIRKILSPVKVSRALEASEKKTPTSSGDDMLSPENAELALRALQYYVEKNFEDVGSNLAAESLKIHYGVEEPRNIRGVTTPDEEKILEEEGVKLLKIPMPVKKADNLN